MLFTLRIFVLRDDFSERINRVIRGFAVPYCIDATNCMEKREVGYVLKFTYCIVLVSVELLQFYCLA
jgi:hypothetical protein